MNRQIQASLAALASLALNMLSRWQYWSLVALGVVALVLVTTNASLVLSNRGQQAELNQRQIFLQQTSSLEGLYREMVKALADLAVRNGDRRVLEEPNAQGINVTVNAPAAADPRAKK